VSLDDEVEDADDSDDVDDEENAEIENDREG
jgi:hypothetical protein